MFFEMSLDTVCLRSRSVITGHRSLKSWMEKQPAGISPGAFHFQLSLSRVQCITKRSQGREK